MKLVKIKHGGRKDQTAFIVLIRYGIAILNFEGMELAYLESEFISI